MECVGVKKGNSCKRESLIEKKKNWGFFFSFNFKQNLSIRKKKKKKCCKLLSQSENESVIAKMTADLVELDITADLVELDITAYLSFTLEGSNYILTDIIVNFN